MEITGLGGNENLKILTIESRLNADLGSNNLEIPMTFELYLSGKLNDT